MFLGIDTSNYTTSVALCQEGGAVTHWKKLLEVKNGEIGLRQGEAVFQHVRNLPALLGQAFPLGEPPALEAVGVSLRPRDAEGSYMPCFLAGDAAASAAACARGIPKYGFSHQAGHVAAALYSAGRLDLIKSPFYAFHFSGGTTDFLLVEPEDQRIFSIRTLAQSLDLKAGQLVDRVGRMLGFSFPAGKALDTLAMESGSTAAARPVFKGADCCLSGLENKCGAMLENGTGRAETARFALSSLAAVAVSMVEKAVPQFGDYPVLCAGGVMGSRVIRSVLSQSRDALFAQEEFSSDNAAGIAVLAGLCHKRLTGGGLE